MDDIGNVNPDEAAARHDKIPDADLHLKNEGAGKLKVSVLEIDMSDPDSIAEALNKIMGVNIAKNDFIILSAFRKTQEALMEAVAHGRKVGEKLRAYQLLSDEDKVNHDLASRIDYREVKAAMFHLFAAYERILHAVPGQNDEERQTEREHLADFIDMRTKILDEF